VRVVFATSHSDRRPRRLFQPFHQAERAGFGISLRHFSRVPLARSATNVSGQPGWELELIPALDLEGMNFQPRKIWL
jgi:hypothetical protein